MEELLAWAVQNGAQLPRVSQDPSNGRKLLATSSIAAGEAVFRLPVGLLLHGGLAFQDPLYGPAFTALWRRYNGGDPTTTRTSSRKNSSRSNEGSAAAAPVVVDLRVMLVLLLVVERCRGQASRWSPYLNILPASYDDPAWWSPADRALLSSTRLAAAAAHYEAGLDQLHALLLELHQLHATLQQEQGQVQEGQGGQQQQEGQQQETRQQDVLPDHPQHQKEQGQGEQQQGQQHQQQQSVQQRGMEDHHHHHHHHHQQQGQQQQGQGQVQRDLLSASPGGWGLSRAAVAWSRSAVWSRAFSVPPWPGGLPGVVVGGGEEGLEDEEGLDGQQQASAGDRAVKAAAAEAGSVAERDAATTAAGGEEGRGGGATAGSGGGGAGASRHSPAPPAVVALVPVVDMCDHHPAQRVRWWVTPPSSPAAPAPAPAPAPAASTATATAAAALVHHQLPAGPTGYEFEFQTLTDVAAGGELFNNYGTTKPNHELLLAYGFVVEPNPHDDLLLTIAQQQQQQQEQQGEQQQDLPETAEEGTAAAGEHDIWSHCQSSAAWQQRQQLARQLSLPLSVSLTLGQPLTGQLLDVLTIMAADRYQLAQLQAWAAVSAAGTSAAAAPPPPQAAAPPAAAVGPQPAATAAAAVSSSMLFRRVAGALQLQVVALLQQMVSVKLSALVPATLLDAAVEAADAGAGKCDAMASSLPAPRQSNMGIDPGLTAGQQHPVHARLARTYVNGQRRILVAVQEAAAAVAGQVLQQMGETASAGAAAAASTAAAADADAVQDGGKQAAGVQLRPGSTWLTGQGLWLTGAVQPGDVLLTCPAAAAIQGPTPLACLVGLLQVLLQGCKQQQQQQQQQALGLEQQEEEEQQEQQQQQVYWWREYQAAVAAGQVALLTPGGSWGQLLEGTPAEEVLQEEMEEVAATCATLQGHGQGQGEQQQGQQQQQQQQGQGLLQALSQALGGAGPAAGAVAWARRVVARGAVPVETAAAGEEMSHEAAGRPGKQQQVTGGAGYALVPLVWQLDQVVRDMCCQVIVTSAQGPTAHLQLCARCHLPPHCLLPTAAHMAATHSSSTKLLLEAGPAALAAAGSGSDAGEDVTHCDASPGVSLVSLVSPGYALELDVAPPEGDKALRRKLALLAAAGVGLEHTLPLLDSPGAPSGAAGTQASPLQPARAAEAANGGPAAAAAAAAAVDQEAADGVEANGSSTCGSAPVGVPQQQQQHHLLLQGPPAEQQGAEVALLLRLLAAMALCAAPRKAGPLHTPAADLLLGADPGEGPAAAAGTAAALPASRKAGKDGTHPAGRLPQQELPGRCSNTAISATAALPLHTSSGAQPPAAAQEQAAAAGVAAAWVSLQQQLLVAGGLEAAQQLRGMWEEEAADLEQQVAAAVEEGGLLQAVREKDEEQEEEGEKDEGVQQQQMEGHGRQPAAAATPLAASPAPLAAAREGLVAYLTGCRAALQHWLGRLAAAESAVGELVEAATAAAGGGDGSYHIHAGGKRKKKAAGSSKRTKKH